MTQPYQRPPLLLSSEENPDDAAVLCEYMLLQRDFRLALDSDPTDWDGLFCLHYAIARWERQAPWLKRVSA